MTLSAQAHTLELLVQKSPERFGATDTFTRRPAVQKFDVTIRQPYRHELVLRIVGWSASVSCHELCITNILTNDPERWMLISKGSPSTMTTYTASNDIELRLVDPAKNKARLYGLTECVTLFGEMCLRIVWGRIGNRHLRERSEVFETREDLERRRRELLSRRRQHGYVETSSHVNAGDDVQRGYEMERAIVEAHGLELRDHRARILVETWHAATRALRAYLVERRQEVLDLEDVSTLASMYAAAAGVG